MDTTYFGLNVLQVFAVNLPWMAWNAFLAVIPLGLAYYAWGGHRRSLPTWADWSTTIVCLLFLPNAMYVVTDLLHLFDQIRYSQFSYLLISLVLLPQYLVLMALGLGSYWATLRLWIGQKSSLLARPGVMVVFLFVLPALIAYGIWLGRFIRLNSWDVVKVASWLTVGELTVQATRNLVDQLFGVSWYLLLVGIHAVILYTRSWRIRIRHLSA